MNRCYFELRQKPLHQTTLLTADMMRHLHTRQYLGKALVVCDNSFSTMRVARKQWLKLARTIQRQRASTLNADKILRFTYTITHMQHMQFAAKTPLESPDAHVFFVNANQLEHAPLNCFTVYVASDMTSAQYKALIAQLPRESLVVDYTTNETLKSLALQPKYLLEAQVETQWEKVKKFFLKQSIDITSLAVHQFSPMDAMDNALDTLLGVSHDFLRRASAFQHILELAQPLRLAREKQHLISIVTLLAYRVQALSPGMSHYMLRTYHEDDTYFLHDIAADLSPDGESILETITRHQKAGRDRLALALLAYVERSNLPEHARSVPAIEF